MDLELLERELAEAGEPTFRIGQVWEWAAKGVGGYGEMTNLPAELRERLAERVPLSALELARLAQLGQPRRQRHAARRLRLGPSGAAVTALARHERPRFGGILPLAMGWG